jgi:hypothetical protein
MNVFGRIGDRLDVNLKGSNILPIRGPSVLNGNDSKTLKESHSVKQSMHQHH